jgi:hypothetical protein
MDRLITMIKLIYRNMKTYKRINKLLKLESKLMHEMKIHLGSFEKDNSLNVSTSLFQSVHYIDEHIKILEQQIKSMELRMRELITK